MNNMIRKLVLIVILSSIGHLDAFGEAHAAPKARTVVLPLQSSHVPPGLAFDPGVVVCEMLSRHLEANHNLRIVKSNAESKLIPEAKMPVEKKSGKEAEEASVEEPKSYFNYQYEVRGKILNFTPDRKMGANHVTPSFADEQAELVAVFEIVNKRNGKVFLTREWRAENGDGTVSFKTSYPGNAWSDPGFLASSIGLATAKLVKSVAAWIGDELPYLPVEVYVIGIDEITNELILNGGSEDGYDVRDMVQIFKITPNFMDSLTGMNLGDDENRLGVARVNLVLDKHSRAKVMAGKIFTKRDAEVLKEMQENPNNDERLLREIESRIKSGYTARTEKERESAPVAKKTVTPKPAADRVIRQSLTAY